MKLNKFDIIFLIGVLIWIAETAYFGFNKQPINGVESALDVLSMLLLAYGFIGGILNSVTVKKEIHISSETANINYEK